jgi:hypothetical protein
LDWLFIEMKSSIALFCIWALLSPFVLFSQKFDNVWVMGYNWDDDPEAETYRLVFDTFPPRLVIAPGEIQIGDAYAGICDSSGQLLLYTNNCSVADGNGKVIPEGDSLALGWELEWCQTYGWHPFHLHNLFLPVGKAYYLLSKSTFKSEGGALVVYDKSLDYIRIEMEGPQKKPKVTQKRRAIIKGNFGYGQVTAAKHGNGRDWWVPLPDNHGNKINMLLLHRDSFLLSHTQGMGPLWANAGSFQASFSPDGSRYARYNNFYGLYLYDFDRCSGLLSNLRYFPFVTTTQGLLSGVGFSPDSRLLYFADYDSLYQLDLSAADIGASRVLVAVWDGHISSLWTKFSWISQGPDGRVYIIPPGTTRSMHVINRPNLTGAACDVQQHFVEFPNPYGNPPNHPNFRLGPLDGSPCDTLGIDNHPLADFRPDPTDTNALAVRFWDVSSYEPAEWLWDFGDGSPASQDTSPVHTFPAPGLYTVCLTVANQYSASSKCKVVEIKTTGSAPLPLGEGPGVRLYPNPTTGLVRLSGTGGGPFRAEVFDLLGRQVFQTTISDPTLDLSGLENGVYLLRVTDRATGKSDTAKLVINK